MNHIQIMGRLTADPELKTTQSGKTLGQFTLAVNNKGKDAGTSFFSCIAWGVAGETIVRYCKKGQRLAVGGEMRSTKPENWDEKFRKWELIVSEFDFIEPKSEETPKEEAPELVEINPDEADLPF